MVIEWTASALQREARDNLLIHAFVASRSKVSAAEGV